MVWKDQRGKNGVFPEIPVPLPVVPSSTPSVRMLGGVRPRLQRRQACPSRLQESRPEPVQVSLTVGIGCGYHLVQRLSFLGWSWIPLEETAVLYLDRVESIRGIYFSQHLTRTTFFKKYFGDKNAKKWRKTKINKHTEKRGVKELFSDLR